MLLSDLLLLFSTKCEVGLPSNSDKIFLLTIFQFLISQKVGFNFAKFPSMSGLNPAEIKYLFLGLTTQPLRQGNIIIKIFERKTGNQYFTCTIKIT